MEVPGSRPQGLFIKTLVYEIRFLFYNSELIIVTQRGIFNMNRFQELLDSIQINTHSSIRMEIPEVIYFDPFHIEGAPEDASYVFITHSHYDHYSVQDIRRVMNDNTRIFVPKSMLGQLRHDGFEERQIVTLTAGMKLQRDEYTVEAIPAYNTLKPFHRKSHGWLGYLIEIDGVRIYVAGDTDATSENRAVSCDIALVPIGGRYTMNAKKAADFVNELRPAAAIPCHYGSIVGKVSDGETFRRRVNPEIKVYLRIDFEKQDQD
uniref:Putative Zn-dependent hydrolase of beta-lactamase fold n=1 Tax=Eubacterium cellulosolvens (strain ATCC 43171 / JCM 9499 / 6) TaxID=633697 RepID=I5ATD2_EUBC6